MNLAKRIIPTLLTRHGHLVKGSQFDSSRIVGNVLQAARIHQARGVDELLVLDVAATPEGRGPDVAAMRQLTEGCMMPIAVGGGVSRLFQVRQLLANGADKVVINTASADLAFIKNCADHFGRQAISVSIDACNGGYTYLSSGQHKQKKSALFHALDCVEAGAGELIIGNIEHEGLMLGYDLRLTEIIAENVSVPVVAVHGAGTYEHLHEGIQAGASAVAAGALFQFTEATPRGAADYLAKQGVEVRS